MNPALVPAVIVGGTAVSYLVAILIGVPALVPFLNVAPAFPFMIASLRRGRVARGGVAHAGLGRRAGRVRHDDLVSRPGRSRAGCSSAARATGARCSSSCGPATAPKGTSAGSFPSMLAHAAVFCALALATGGLLAMPLGAMLMNYMAYYVGALGAASAHPWKAMALAWVPWALIRIAGFVTLGVVLAGPVLGRILGSSTACATSALDRARRRGAPGRRGPEMGAGAVVA